MKNLMNRIWKPTKRLALPVLTAGALSISSPAKAQDEYIGDMEIEETPSKLLKDYISSIDFDYETFMNPFFQPNDTSLVYYGSGDVDSSGAIDWEDYDAMQSGAQNDMADVDGDGTPSTEQDQQELSDYLNGNIPYLQSNWNNLQTREERGSWLKKMLVLDGTDTLFWHNENVQDRFVSGNFASQICLNFWGWEPHSNGNSGDTLFSKYHPESIGRFNMPVYFVGVNFNDGTGMGHGMNVVLTGDNPLDFDDWNLIEPQNDSTNVNPGGWNIPYGSVVGIYSPRGFGEQSLDMIRGPPIIGFDIDDSGNGYIRYVDGVSPNPDLILERPTLSVDDKQTIPEKYSLSQNYPNPFNSRTQILFNLPDRCQTQLTVYDLLGRKVVTLVDGILEPGTTGIKWDGNNKYGRPVASGMYIYKLNAITVSNGKTFSQSRKMVLIK